MGGRIKKFIRELKFRNVCLNLKWKGTFIVLICLAAYILSIYAAFGSEKFGIKSGSQSEKKVTRQMILDNAEHLAASYDYDEALRLLSSLKHPGEDGEELALKCEEGKKSLVKYDGQIYHVFFHSLIVYPSLAFDGDYKQEGYNMWMTTADEFKKMLPLLYQNGFILVDFDDFISRDAEGNAGKKDLYLPKGKKPLVISIDDVNYYGYMKGDGFADKLVIDENGEVKTLVTTPEGNSIITSDGDVIPILDEFVKNNPAFSYKGAKGIIAVTGYEGALGYRINPESETRDEEMTECKKVARRLAETGWSFACHSYTHNDYFRDYTATLENVSYDTDKWKAVIEPAVGNTDIYISPFGYMFGKDDERFKYVIDSGFKIYCPVSTMMTTTYGENYIIQDRFNLDGYTMMKNPDKVNEIFFDVSKVLDKNRPALVLQ